MSAERQISGVAEQQLAYLYDTYGIGNAVDDWCRSLTDAAIPAKTGGSEFDFSDVLEKTGEAMQNPEAFQPADEVELAVKAAKWGWGVLGDLRKLSRTGWPGCPSKLTAACSAG